jgi:hypothetical protein
MPHYGYDDASMTNGLTFRLGQKRKSGFLDLFDCPPPCVGESVNSVHIRNRKRWKQGIIVKQVTWSNHGKVSVVETSTGIQLAVWISELDADPNQREILLKRALSK